MGGRNMFCTRVHTLLTSVDLGQKQTLCCECTYTADIKSRKIDIFALYYSEFLSLYLRETERWGNSRPGFEVNIWIEEEGNDRDRGNFIMRKFIARISEIMLLGGTPNTQSEIRKDTNFLFPNLNARDLMGFVIWVSHSVAVEDSSLLGIDSGAISHLGMLIRRYQCNIKIDLEMHQVWSFVLGSPDKL